MSGDEESYEEHVLQNNTRLVSIATNLRDPAHFAAACTELTQWCSDPRAYTPHFEENLLSALQICVENGTKDGFDFTLAHQLITCCFQHRKLLSKESAVRINRWYEQYRRIKKNGGKRKRKSEMPPVDPGGLEQITVTDSGCTSMWPQGGPTMAGAAPLTSPGYPQMMMPGYGNMPQQSPFPMDPTGARPGYPEGGFDQAAMIQHQQRMMQMRMSQQQQRGRMMATGPIGYQDPAAATMYQIPMGANSVPGQSQPLLRMPSQPGQAYPPMMAGRGPLMSPAYPQPNSHQMIKASPPVLFSNLQQQQPQSQPVMSYPNPHAVPGPYEMGVVFVPSASTLVPPFSLPDGMSHYQTNFSVPADIYAHLSNNPHFNLQLKSYSSTDDTGTNRTQWPLRPGTNELAVQISINGTPVPIAKNRSSMIKSLVKEGENKLEIQCIPLPFKHSFSIQPITIMPMARFTEDIFTLQQRKGLTSESFKQKMINKGNGNAVSIPLLDGRSGKRMRVPARSFRCQHSNSFELHDLLLTQGECGSLLCPVQGCNTTFSLTELEVDLFVGEILRYVTTNNSSSTEAVIEPNGCWRLVEPSSAPVDSRKRPSTDDANMHSLKRIKSEQFPPSSGSPFPTANSVPGGMSFGQSPATNLMSPFGSNISPKKEIMSPPAAGVTSLTPQPAIKEEHQSLPGAATLTSPHGLPVVNNGSVDSVNGSAPYTPASLNGTAPGQAAAQHSDANNVSLSTLENEILEPFRPDSFSVHSPIEIQKYLQDPEMNTRCHNYTLDEATLTYLIEILNMDAIKTWGMDLRSIEKEFSPLILPLFIKSN